MISLIQISICKSRALLPSAQIGLLGFGTLRLSMKCMNLLGGNIKTRLMDQKSQKSNTGWLPFKIDKEFLLTNGFQPFYGRSRKKSLSGRVFYNHIFGAKTRAKNSICIPGLENFASVIINRNVMGIQFHPEKSQLLGKLLLEFIL